ncbi:MAG: carboxypeptidase-like regulatory domain-containing protein, partial [Acidobacteriota bacterium]
MTVKKIIGKILIGLTMLLAWQLGLVDQGQAQGLTGQISGTVVDAQGAAVPNVQVEITNEETARVVTVVTDAQGNFVAPQLLSGSYSITITASGFKKFERRAIPVSANERVPVRIALEIGDVSQTVTITAEQTFVKTESAERAGL